MPPEHETIAALIHRAADALGEEAGLHIDLVKAEVGREVRTLGRDLVPVVAGALLLGVGYAFSGAAVAILLSPWLGVAGSVALFGFLNLLVGGIAMRRGVLALQSRGFLEASVGSELDRSARGIMAAFTSPAAEIEQNDVG